MNNWQNKIRIPQLVRAEQFDKGGPFYSKISSQPNQPTWPNQLILLCQVDYRWYLREGDYKMRKELAPVKPT